MKTGTERQYGSNARRLDLYLQRGWCEAGI